MKRILVVFIVLLAISGGGYWAAMNYAVPATARDSAENYLHSFGGNNLNIQDVTQGKESLTLRNITFDEDGFHTLERMEVSYAPSMLLNNQAGTITLQGLNLSPQINNLNMDAARQWLTQKPLAKILSVQNARLAVYHPEIGMLNFDMNAQIRFEGGDKFQLQANLDSKQKQLGLELTMTGDGTWKDGQMPRGIFKIDVANSNLNLMNLQINRVSGAIEIEAGDALTVKPTLYAGALNLFGLPWQNVQIQTSDTGRAVLSATSFPRPGEDARQSLLVLLNAEPVIGIRAKTLSDFLGYLERYGAQLGEHQKALTYETLDNVHVRLYAREGGVVDKLIQRTPLPSIDIVIGKEGLHSQIKETILLPH